MRLSCFRPSSQNLWLILIDTLKRDCSVSLSRPSAPICTRWHSRAASVPSLLVFFHDYNSSEALLLWYLQDVCLVHFLATTFYSWSPVKNLVGTFCCAIRICASGTYNESTYNAHITKVEDLPPKWASVMGHHTETSKRHNHCLKKAPDMQQKSSSITGNVLGTPTAVSSVDNFIVHIAFSMLWLTKPAPLTVESMLKINQSGTQLQHLEFIARYLIYNTSGWQEVPCQNLYKPSSNPLLFTTKDSLSNL